LADHLSSLNEAIAHLDASDMEMAEKLGQELTELEASDWANLQELAKKLSQIPNVEGIDQITEKVDRKIFFFWFSNFFIDSLFLFFLNFLKPISFKISHLTQS
jgi:hypothetical protein